MHSSAIHPVDFAAMRRQLGDDDELIADVITLFLDDYVGRLQALAAAVEARDAAAVRSAAHTLKGSASAFGAARVVGAAERLEIAAEVQDSVAISRGVACLIAEVHQLADALRMYHGQERVTRS